ncbi:hypothetical protein LTSEINV_6204 [Salmonella enterica subsp. enterica serovar Inverness str. R8-3668]|uniref:Uncharacterized protein n=1 Tax=Salmonella enterica subsp. enterica serovar Inverness str. R8-3668 TaxID=913075 RepID=G5NLU7_SALET|nr:hypothetical protein LTSEINV_6204 [Salmonella enterica subsp. enterica serovar Inverness str. R8-3668]
MWFGIVTGDENRRTIIPVILQAAGALAACDPNYSGYYTYR